jgi:hypothetical protein
VILQHPHAELSAYIDGELDPAAQAAVDRHLVTCDLCRADVAQLRATVALMRALPDPLPSRRLTPRIAAPAWLAPLRTLMTLASGAAVFLFIASALVSNITFLAGGSATTASAPEAARDTAVKGQVPAAAEPASTATPAVSPNAGFALGPSASAAPSPAKRSDGTAAPQRSDNTAASGSAAASAAPDVAPAPQEAARASSTEPQRSQVPSPWLWLALAVICGAIALALHRRLRTTV